MTSFYNLLKYAATGIASPDMTYFDKMRASTLMGGTVQTLTGQPPLSFKSNGTPLISWSMKGNGSQTGTPTPDNPVIPTFCGVRTANLVDITTFQDGMHLDQTTGLPTSYGGSRIATMQPIDVSQCSNVTLTFSEITHSAVFMYSLFNGDALIERVANKKSGDTIDTSNATRMYLSLYSCIVSDVIYIMLNSGSTALPYEPFGWAEKITCAGQTVPVYLGEVPTVRRITKIKLNSLQWENYTDGNTLFFRSTTEIPRVSGSGDGTMYCTIYKSYTSRANIETLNYGIAPANAVANNRLCVRDTRYSTTSDWLAANGNAELWFINANETTEISNEPLAKIGTYADELHIEDAGVTIPTVKGDNTLTVETELQPSEMSITYKG